MRYIYQWIGLRKNLQETMDFPIEYGPFLYIIFPSNQSIEYNIRYILIHPLKYNMGKY